jgi:hypothetical protein
MPKRGVYPDKIGITERLLSKLLEKINKFFSKKTAFPGSLRYWETRYASGGTSGAGSYGKFSEFKADILNKFVDENNVLSVIEFGCGDGNQLLLARYPRYSGYDVSKNAIELCVRKFSRDQSKSFRLMNDYGGETADLSLSLDVIYHLIEDDVYELYMRRLFSAAKRHVIIYSINGSSDLGTNSPHVKPRKFTDWVEKNATSWSLVCHIPNRYPYKGDHTRGSFADFYIYDKRD